MDGWKGTRRLEYIEYLPEDIDITQGILYSRKGTFECEKRLGGGSQGEVYLFSDGTHRVVFKHYRSQASKSTQCKDIEYGPWWAFINELEMLRYLSNVVKIFSFWNFHPAAKDFTFFPKTTHKGHKIGTHYFINYALGNSPEDVWSALPSLAAPLEVCRVMEYEDKRTGKSYIPCGTPPSQAESLKMNMVSLFSLYEYIEGRTLGEFITANPDYDRREAVVKALMSSAGMLHWFGVVHRDIRPEHIIVDNQGRVRFLDFGISQRFAPSDRVSKYLGLEQKVGVTLSGDESIFSSKHWKGSRVYSPPNIFSQSVSNQDDIFSVSLLSELIMGGMHPFFDPPSKDLAGLLALNNAEKKQVARNYGEQLKCCRDSSMMQKMFLDRFEKYHPRLPEVKQGFHPDQKERCPRMIALTSFWRDGHPEMDSFPPLIDLFELLPEKTILNHYYGKRSFNLERIDWINPLPTPALPPGMASNHFLELYQRRLSPAVFFEQYDFLGGLSQLMRYKHFSGQRSV